MASNIRIRESKDSKHFYGFSMKKGYLFGTSVFDDGRYDWVYTGKIRNAKRADGTVYGKEVMVYRRFHKHATELDQRTFSYEWAPIWISAGNGLGKKIYLKRTKIVPDWNPSTPAPGRHLFKTDCYQIG